MQASVRKELHDNGAAGRTATVIIDNTAKLNTLNSPLMLQLTGCIEALARDPALRAVVLRGGGTQAFIGGADIREMARLNAATAETFISTLHRCCMALRRLPVPVIARIQGYALGAGLEIAAACDLRIASEDSRFGMPEVRVGIPSVIEAALLPRLIGWGRTRRLLFTGEMIEAPTAQAWGLVEELAAPAELDAVTNRTVQAILKAGPTAIRLQKALMREWEEVPLEEAVRRGIGYFSHAWETKEPQRMMQAFLDVGKERKRS